MVECFSDLQFFFTSTLLHAQHDHAHLNKQCTDAVAKLVAMDYITLEPSGDLREGKYLITPLGRAAFKGQLLLSSWRWLSVSECCMTSPFSVHAY